MELVKKERNAVFELNDGCVCCTVREDLVDTFEEIFERRDEFDHILIETTAGGTPGRYCVCSNVPPFEQPLP